MKAVAPSSCLRLQSDTDGLLEAACSSSRGGGGLFSVMAVVRKFQTAPAYVRRPRPRSALAPGPRWPRG
eukprot:14804583-Alexandrium_andersonii.AAC.1